MEVRQIKVIARRALKHIKSLILLIDQRSTLFLIAKAQLMLYRAVKQVAAKAQLDKLAQIAQEREDAVKRGIALVEQWKSE